MERQPVEQWKALVLEQKQAQAAFTASSLARLGSDEVQAELFKALAVPGREARRGAPAREAAGPRGQHRPPRKPTTRPVR
jgi:hypothetical protein